MVNNLIKVYARIKRETASKKVELENYIISRSNKEHDDFIFHHSSSDVRFSYYQFRYHKIFDQLSTQKEIFEMVAKPVVNSVINGFNGTIFAYGQNPEAYSIQLSYLEIYNEIGYDLLNPKQMSSKLEEFPRVILLDDGKGKAHLRNLSVHAVSTEREAMRLLFLGDTNRTIAETPMNDYSSRSHCIFTVYLTSQMKRNNKTLKSKLHVVDLAGSERIGKSSITGSILNEAKNINLSLHYLEQVITALSVGKKHIPFRNSMLTYILKDSLCGNSLTTMLATLAVTKKNIEETVSTCRFAERVSMITTKPIINEEEFDSQKEINILQNEICELKTKLSKYEGDSKIKFDNRNLLQEKNQIGVNSSLLPSYVTQVQFSQLGKYEQYRKILDEFLNYKMNVTDLTLTQMKHCMEVMREMCRDKVSFTNSVDAIITGKTGIKKIKNRDVTMSDSLQEKDIFFPKEINNSNSQFDFENTNINYKLEAKDRPPNVRSEFTRNKNIEEIEEYHEKLKIAYEKAKSKAAAIEKCRQNIITLRKKMDRRHNLEIGEQLVLELYRQQDVYRRIIFELRELEKETSHLKFGLLQSEMRMRKSCSNISDFVNVESFAALPNNSFTTPYDRFSYDSYVTSDKIDLNHYTSEDYNRPEKENVETKTLTIADDQNRFTSAEVSEQAGRTSSSFLELLTDVSGSSGKKIIDLVPEKEESFSVQNRTMNCCKYHKESNSPSCNLQDVNNNRFKKKQHRFLTENSMNRVEGLNFEEYQKQKSTSIRENSSENSIGMSLQPELKPFSTLVSKEKIAASEHLWDIDSDQNQIKNNIEVQKHSTENPVGINRRPDSRIFPNLFPRDNSSTSDSLRDINYGHNSERYSNSISAGNNLHEFVKTEELFKETDSLHFKEFIKTVPLTGDKDIDEEIMTFYRSKFKN